jgi:cytochrome c biogenesis protein CcdA
VGSALAFSFLAGALSTLSPCVLPLLPILVGGALQHHRLAPAAVACGLAVSFTAVGLLVASLGVAAGLDVGALHIAAAWLMAGFGAVLLSARLQAGFVRWVTPLTGGANSLLAQVSGDGLAGQFLLGMLLGAVWSPCTGPTLGAAVGMAAESGTVPKAAAIMAVFSVGAVAPLMALAYGSRRAMMARRHGMARLASWAKPIMGVALLGMGLLIASGLDKPVETRLTDSMPAWLIDLTTRF